MFAAFDQSASRSLYLADGIVHVRLIEKAKTDVIDTAPADPPIAGLTVDRDQIRRAGGSEEDHRGTVAELFLHAEHLGIETQRPIEVLHNQMGVGQTLRADHVS